MRVYIIVGLCVVMIVVSGCSGVNVNYYNPNYPSNNQQYFFKRDRANCWNYAQAVAPPPQVNYIDTSPISTYGNFNVSGGGNSYTGTYNSTTYSADTTASFINGMNMTNALLNPDRQESLSENCMTGLGWYRVKHKYDLPPPAGNQNLNLIQAHLSKNGFSNLRYVNGIYYMVRGVSKDNNIIKMTIANIYQNGKVSADGKVSYMYAVATYVVSDNIRFNITEFSAFDESNKRVLYENVKTSDFNIKEGSLVYIYMLDYGLI